MVRKFFFREGLVGEGKRRLKFVSIYYILENKLDDFVKVILTFIIIFSFWVEFDEVKIFKLWMKKLKFRKVKLNC